MTAPADVPDSVEREFDRADGATYVVRAVRAGGFLRDYGPTGGAADVIPLAAELVSMGVRHFVRPGWTVGIFLWRRRRIARLVHKEHLPAAGDPVGAVDVLVQRLSEG